MSIVKSVLPVIIMILLGMLARQKKFISLEGIDGMQSFVMNITLPTVVFNAFYNTSISAGSLILPVTPFVLVSAGLLIGKPISRFLKLEGNYAPFLLSGYEVGMLGYALLTIIAKNGDVSAFAMMDVGHELVIFTVYLAMLKATGGIKQQTGEAVKMLLKTPVLIAILLGVLFSITGIGRIISGSKFGPVLDSVLEFVSAPTGAVILLVIGYRMDFRKLEWSPVLKMCASRIILQTVFGVVVVTLYKFIGGICSTEAVVQAMIMMLILPPPFIIPLYAEGEREKSFTSSVLSVYTMISIVLFIIMLVYFK